MRKLWKCSICNYVHEGAEAPDVCPKCGATKDKFVGLSEEEANKVYSSDRTNDIHMKLVEYAMKVEKLCQEGIQLNLDPNCVKIFEETKKDMWILKQKAKAELEGHMKKGKW